MMKANSGISKQQLTGSQPELSDRKRRRHSVFDAKEFDLDRVIPKNLQKHEPTEKTQQDLDPNEAIDFLSNQEYDQDEYLFLQSARGRPQDHQQ